MQTVNVQFKMFSDRACSVFAYNIFIFIFVYLFSRKCGKRFDSWCDTEKSQGKLNLETAYDFFNTSKTLLGWKHWNPTAVVFHGHPTHPTRFVSRAVNGYNTLTCVANDSSGSSCIFLVYGMTPGVQFKRNYKRAKRVYYALFSYKWIVLPATNKLYWALVMQKSIASL